MSLTIKQKVIKQVENEIRWLTDKQYGLDDMSEPFPDALQMLWMEGFDPAQIAQEFVEYTFPDPLPKEC